jgi:hypothetical protein
MIAARLKSLSQWSSRSRSSLSGWRCSVLRWLGVVGLTVLVGVGTGCVDGPRAVNSSDVFSSQKKVSTLQHWKMIADVSANDLWRDEYASRESFCKEHNDWPQTECDKHKTQKVNDPKPAPDPTRCVIVQQAPTAGKTKFQVFLESELTTDLVRGQQAQVMDTAYGDEIRSPAQCDLASIDSIYVRHKVYKATPFPGQYTILASGLVLVRDVARAFNFPRAIGLVALGEGAFWLGAGLHGHGDMAEIAVTVSRTNPSGIYQRRITNIYYIDERESRLYDRGSDSNSDSGEYRHPEPPEYVAFDAGSAQSGKESLSDLSNCTVEKHDPPCPPPPAPKGPSFGKLQVSPGTISNCDSYARFTVMGSALSASPDNYHFGPIAASSVGPKVSVKDPAGGKDPFDAIEVKFEQLQTANRGLDPVTLTAETPQGAATSSVSIKGSCTPSSADGKTGSASPAPTRSTLSGSWILDVKNSKVGSGLVSISESRDYVVTQAGEESMTAKIARDKVIPQTLSYTKAKENGPDAVATDSSGPAVVVSVKRKDKRSTSALYKAKDGTALWIETCVVSRSGKDLTVTKQGLTSGNKYTDVLLFHK